MRRVDPDPGRRRAPVREDGGPVDPPPATSARDPRIVALRELQRDRGRRDSEGLAVVDQEALLLAALEAGCAVASIVEAADRRGEPAPWRALLGGAAPIPAGGDALRALAALGRLPRVVAAVRRHPEPVGAASGGLALAGVADAGNVGTIVRTAAAFGLPSVTLLPGCADPWGRKALRASQGAAFSAGLLRRGAGVAALRDGRGRTAPVLAAVARGGEEPARLPADAVVLLGAEDEGLSDADVAACDGRVTIPADGFESLGVASAAAVLAHELARARRAVGIAPEPRPRATGRRA